MPYAYRDRARVIGPRSGRPLIYAYPCAPGGDAGHGYANVARLRFAARPGIAHGPNGDAWALPALDARGRTSRPEHARRAARALIDWARSRPGVDIVVCRIATPELADAEAERALAPLFAGAPDNVFVPSAWLPTLGIGVRPVVVSSSFSARSESLALWDMLDRAAERAARDGFRLAIIEGGGRGGERTARDWAGYWGVARLQVSADWHARGRGAGAARNEFLAHLGAELIGFPDPLARDTRHLRQLFSREDKPAQALPVGPSGLPRKRL